MNTRSVVLIAAWAALYAPAAAAQGVVVDEGRFAITVNGRGAGTEDFVIRRARLGRENALFANAVIVMTGGGAAQEIRPLLRAAPLDGAADSYQVQVTGLDQMELRLVRSGRRFVATISSAIGQEDREFQAMADTRVVELDVAHHYYFLRDLRGGEVTPALEPRSRRQLRLVADVHGDEELRLGPNLVEARRVVFSAGDGDARLVWYDRLGRVLRVEVPSRGYVAERTDLVG
jgi:hypothetical protein